MTIFALRFLDLFYITITAILNTVTEGYSIAKRSLFH